MTFAVKTTVFSLLAALWASAALGATSFVVDLGSEQTADMAADSLGFTYVVTASGTGQSTIRKYDPSGAQIQWLGDGAFDRIINGLTPLAVCIAPGNTNLYLAGLEQIVQIAADTGTVLNSTNVPGTITPKGIFCD